MSDQTTIDWWDRRHVGLGAYEAVGCDGVGESFNAWMYRVRRRVFRRVVGPLLPEPVTAAVLDVGSGFGFYVDRWRDLGVSDVTASDAAPAALARLRRRHPDVATLPLDITAPRDLPARTFDAVSAFDVLFHIVDDVAYERAISNLAAVLRPGGLLVFSENFRPDAANAVSPVQVDRGEREILGHLSATGLEPVCRAPMFWLMNEPQNSRSAIHHLWWRKLGGTLRARPALGVLAGPVLYPLELALVRRGGPGPSTDLMVCRRR